MAKKAAAIRFTDDSEIRTSDRSIPGNCGRIRCSASPTEARYNTLLSNVLPPTTPLQVATHSKEHPRKDSRFGKLHAHLEILKDGGRIGTNPHPRRATHWHLG